MNTFYHAAVIIANLALFCGGTTPSLLGCWTPHAVTGRFDVASEVFVEVNILQHRFVNLLGGSSTEHFECRDSVLWSFICRLLHGIAGALHGIFVQQLEKKT